MSLEYPVRWRLRQCMQAAGITSVAELHEKIRIHSMAAARVVKEEGKENDLIERILNDDSLKLDKSKLKEVLDPKNFIGFAPIQTEEFIANEVQPIIDANQDLIGLEADLKV